MNASAVFLPRITPDGLAGKRFAQILALVALLHALFVGWMRFEWPDLEPRKLPDIVVELSGSVMPSAPPSEQTVAKPAPKPAVKPPPVVPVPPPPVLQSQEPDAPKLVATPQPVQPPPVVPQAPTPPAAVPTPPAQSSATTNPTTAAPTTAVSKPSTSGSNNDAVKTIDADYKASYLNNPKPPYPRTAHRLGIEGTVVLVAEVGEDGRPSQVQLFKSSGNDLLDESALNTVKQWKFTPGKKEGKISRSVVKIPITFSLRGKR